MKMLQQQWSGKGSLWVLLLLTVGGALTACRDNAISDLSPADSPVYITNYDRSINFGQYKTFSLPDSVIIESNNSYATAKNSISDRFVSNVANALTSRGFQRVDRGQKADLGVAVILVNNQYTGVASNPYSYYSNYWGYGGLGGYGYSPYSPSYYTYEVTDRYWEIQIVDLKNSPTTSAGQQQQLSVVYDATIRGADIIDTQSVDAATSAIFSQSPYLQVTR
ncbi:DUF4136 domain-containing protein [Spirosoma sp. BT702]|uniref:DUF4136 domain-containing protein n=1 Tax=Spirosoma profusum TaxID=2771354 RepID=A0A926XV40_9BACT|nr:DUF4136 domain-containing protein [Spirosoma profusum]MBD2700734.1 DUF4136 domain-containing protein [Spirosoma profusum]